MKKINKILSIILILALLVPGLSIAVGNNDNQSKRDIINRIIEDIKIENEKLNEEWEYDEIFKPEDEVRIIVELQSKPSISYATSKGVSYDSLAKDVVGDIERDLKVEQEAVKNEIKASRINMEYFHSFQTAFNGFSGKVRYDQIKSIERLKSVKKVYIANEYERPDVELDMLTSNDMVGALPTWLEGYKGEKTVIAILDTGIDYRHKDMIISDGVETKISEADLEGLDLLGRYFTEKVPYGYNYYDLNDEVLDLGPDPSMHGMHVAGTAGANGDPENGGIKGVAPEAQLLAMKVFSNDPIYATTFSDIYLVAIEESVRLGADVINMSLGSVASFYIPESAEDVAITNATDNGILVSVSAGNSAKYGDGYWYPFKDNPDIGVVGAPGLNKDTIQVASIENTNQQVNIVTYDLDGEEKQIPMSIAGNIKPSDIFDGPVEFIDGGFGALEDMVDAKGKIVIASRGGPEDVAPFVTKIENAQAVGAAGIIVRNHADGGEELVNMQTPPVHTIPAVFVGYTGGMELLNLEEKFVSFPEETIKVTNPAAGLMSDFTSWGTTPSLELKPEITAPGGQIWSTLNDDYYGNMSGTSMAAPHVSGGSALVMEYIKAHDEFKDLTLAEQTRLAKLLLMNTATPIIDEYNTEYSPRRQGAGLMNLQNAVNTPVRVVNTATNEGKVELKDFTEDEFTMNLKAFNTSDEDLPYKVDVSVLVDVILLDPYGDLINFGASEYMQGAKITTNLEDDILVVPANGQVEFEVKVDISEYQGLYDNMFIEGFISLENIDDSVERISGGNRYTTAVAISQETYDEADTVILASGESFPDALAGTTLADLYKAPILLTGKDEVRQEVLDEIDRLDAKKVILLGGEFVISEAVVEQLEGYEVERIAGGNRNTTAVEIGKLIVGETNSKSAILVNGHNFPDGLSVGPGAAIGGNPILFGEEDVLPQASLDALEEWGIEEITIVGGPFAISEELEADLVKEGYTVDRIAGGNRYTTALEIAKAMFETPDTVILASGENFPDALAGGPLAAKLNAPLLLVAKDQVRQEVFDYIEENEITKIIVLGGEGVISNLVLDDLVVALNIKMPDLSLPYVGFYGEWDEPDILEGLVRQNMDNVYYGSSGLLHERPDGLYYYVGETIWLNPGSEAVEDGDSYADNILPYLTFYRNAEEVQYNILDKDGNLLRNIGTQQFVRKNYYDSGRNPNVQMRPAGQWDGTVNNEYLEDGDYFYEIKSKIHYEGADYQSMKIPVGIDTVGPEITDIEFDLETNILTFNAVDAGVGAYAYVIFIGDDLGDVIMLPDAAKEEFEVDLSDVVPAVGEVDIEIYGIDQLNNESVAEYSFVRDNQSAFIYILEPGLLEAYDTSKIMVEGYVANYMVLDKVIINEEIEADIEFIENVVLTHPDDPSTILYSGPAYKFTKVVEFEDGYQELKVEAVSKTGARSSLVRRFYVDTTPAELDIEVKSIDDENMTAELEIRMYDNLGYLTLFQGDSQIYSYSEPLVIPDPTEKIINHTVNLVEGENKFIFTLYDLVDHETVEEVVIQFDGN